MSVARMLAVGALAAGLALPVAASEVVLRSHDGTISLTGTLQSFDGEIILLDTAIGPIRVIGFQVTCEGAACPPPEALRQTFRIAGAPDLARILLPALVEEYGLRADVPVLRQPIDAASTRFILGDGDVPLAELVTAGAGDDAGFAELAAKAAKIGVSTRRIGEAEAEAIRAAGLGDPVLDGREHVVALDGLVAAVAPGNPLALIAMPDLVSLLSGRITSWADLGGPDAPVTVYLAAAGGGTREAIEAMLMQPYGARLSDGIRALADDAAVADAVAGDPGGIGIVSLAFLRSARALDLRAECGIVARPDDFSIKAEEYPLTRRLYLYTAGGPMPPEAGRLVDFALSDPAQPVIADAGFVNQSIAGLRLDRQGMRLAATLLGRDLDIPVSEMREMVETLMAAERLSVTLRFLPGANLLDPRAEADVSRLGAHLAAGGFQGREVLLIGFTDAVGRADQNRDLSLQRAEQVRQAILAAVPPGALDGVTLTALGYGEMSPLGCNETPEGRRVNRRVEVWLRDRERQG
jgi:phosphate transport system substrate-binding protein